MTKVDLFSDTLTSTERNFVSTVYLLRRSMLRIEQASTNDERHPATFSLRRDWLRVACQEFVWDTYDYTCQCNILSFPIICIQHCGEKFALGESKVAISISRMSR